MASKKDGLLRGAKLVKKALGETSTTIPSPEPIPGSLVRKLVLPNGEKLSAGLKELLAFDGSWLGIEYDDEEGEVEGTALEDLIEEEFGEEAVASFGEAIEMFTDDCVAFAATTNPKACLYVGEADDSGEYPVLVFSYADGTARIGGFIPFDVWAAQELGALEKGAFGSVPADYAAFPASLAEANGDGRIIFEPKAGEARSDDDDDEDEKDTGGSD